MRVAIENQETSSAAAVARDPARLAALCELWKAAERAVWLTLAGYSMAPTLLPGTRVLLDCSCRPESAAIGDILAVRRDSALVIHRLVEIAEGSPPRFICQGDANSWRDDPVEAHAIVGKVVQARPPALLVRMRKRIGHLLRVYRRRAADSAGNGAAA